MLFFSPLEAEAQEGIFRGDQKLIFLKGLDQVSVDTDSERLPGDFGIVKSGDHDNGDQGVLDQKRAEEIHAGFARQIDIAENQVETGPRNHFPGRFGIRGCPAVIPVFFEQPDGQFLKGRIVVQHQYSSRHVRIRLFNGLLRGGALTSRPSA